MRKLSLILPLALVLVACGSGGPVGTYEVDMDALASDITKMVQDMMPKAVWDNMPEAKKQEALNAAKKKAEGVKISFELKADNSFTASHDDGEGNKKSGTGDYEIDGEKIKLTITHENGEKKKKAEIAEGTIKDGVIRIKVSKEMPFAIVLRKK